MPDRAASYLTPYARARGRKERERNEHLEICFHRDGLIPAQG